jgi:hypothetical protein
MVVIKVMCDGNCDVCQLSNDTICMAKTGKIPAEVVIINEGM